VVMAQMPLDDALEISGGIGAPSLPTAANANESFNLDLQRFAGFWSAPHSLTRIDDAMAKSTVDGHVQWAKRYRIHHSGDQGNSPAGSLRDLVADLPCFMRYLDARMDKSSGTRARDADSFLACLKFTHAPYSDADPPKAIALVRNTRSQLQRAYETDLRSRYVSVILCLYSACHIPSQQFHSR
jgi:hypothetical protein